MIKNSLVHIFTKKRRITIFILSIILPLIVILIFSIDTFLKRQKVTNDLLESNLILKGNSAVEAIEKSFFELENDFLSDSSLSQLLNAKIKLPPKYSFLRHIILNEKLDVVFPNVNSQKDDQIITFDNPEFSSQYTLAVRNEFILDNQARATSYYQDVFENSQNTKEKALALEGICRTLTKQEKYDKAVEYLQLMLNNYGNIQNNSGHPSGIVGALQLYEISKQINSNIAIDTLISTYRKIKYGYWKLTLSSYQFFIAEIEDILNRELLNSEDKIKKDMYSEIKEFSSSFYDDLLFYSLIEEHILPQIREQKLNSNNQFTANLKRIFIETEESKMLIAYKGMPGFIFPLRLGIRDAKRSTCLF